MPTLPRGLASHLQPGEQVHLVIPAIWVAAHPSSPDQQNDASVRAVQSQERESTTCDVILTNRRLIGYLHIRFPRERLFLDEFPLYTLTAVSLRQKSFEPLFQELLLSDGQRRAYIRSSRPRIEQLYAALRSSGEQHVTTDTLQPETTDSKDTTDAAEFASTLTPNTPTPPPIYGRQELQRSFEQSPLSITLLFIGGLLLEVIGIILWYVTSSLQVGLPLCIAGLACVIVATIQRRRYRA